MIIMYRQDGRARHAQPLSRGSWETGAQQSIVWLPDGWTIRSDEATDLTPCTVPDEALSPSVRPVPTEILDEYRAQDDPVYEFDEAAIVRGFFPKGQEMSFI